MLGERDHLPGKYRTYSAGDLDRLMRIKRLKEILGLHLAEIKEILALDEERRALMEEVEVAGRGADVKDRLERVREITLIELDMVRERKISLSEYEKRLNKRLSEVERRLGGP